MTPLLSLRFFSRKRTFASLARSVAFLSAVIWSASVDASAATPAGSWARGRPEGIGVSSRKLNALSDRLAASNANAILVIRDERVIHEWYAPGTTADTPVFGLQVGNLLNDRQCELVFGRSTVADRVSARDAARFGRLLLRRGDWNGSSLVDAAALERRITARAGSGEIPTDAFWIACDSGEVLFVVPSERLIAVRAGSPLASADALRRTFLEPVVDALILSGRPMPAQPPYPPSPVIAGVTWAPKSEIIRRARGGDNWPVTWGDDNALYTAYGDGNGFEPFVPEKLSMGLAKVTGSPPDFQGVNLRSSSAESTGADAAGHKASGMLMVDGVLYMLTRNTDNSRLAWSRDHGVTWTWADWRFTTSFGHPTFLNFGQNYGGARDGFVYVYSQDSDSSYEAADRMVLARVPKDRIRQRDAYEFFQALDAAGQPRWTRDVNQRGAVFTAAGRCYRTGISYSATLKRYLWCQILPASKHRDGPRFQGGFGIYDAPEPWGPWTTVFYTTEWDVGPGEASSLPTKWMSADGRTMHLLFSGDDSFSVRPVTLHLKDK